MAIKKKKIQMHKKYSNGDIDTLYPITRAEDVLTDDAGTTLASKITKLDNIQEGATTVAGSSTNGNIKINGTETKVYTHPNSGATAGSYNKVTVNAQGHVTAGQNVTDWNGTVSGNASNATVAFTAASSRANLTTGEKLSVAFGKLAKLYNDLKSLAFVDSVGTSQLDSTLLAEYNKRVTTDNVTESTAITEAGWVADARAVAALQNSITTINSNIANIVDLRVTKLNDLSIDWNTIINPGFYYATTTTSTDGFTNAPSDVVNGIIQVMRFGTLIKQIWYRQGTINTNDYYTYIRSSSDTGSTWSNWKKFSIDGHNHSAANINSGTLGVARGGTGATTFTSGAALIGNGTNAVTTRAITDNTKDSAAITGSTNLVTMNTLRYALNRTTGLGTNDTNYGTVMMRGIKAVTKDPGVGSSLTSGAICLVYTA